MQKSTDREYKSSSFQTTKQWVHFNLQHDLQNCRGCRQSARRRLHDDVDSSRWFCSDCHAGRSTPLSVHPMIRALLDGESVPRVRCERSGARIHWNEAWISNDCQHVFRREEMKRDQALQSIERALQLLDSSYRGPDAPRKIDSLVPDVDRPWGPRKTVPMAAEAVQMTESPHDSTML
ncbi:MAG: hypothetical protein HN891_09990 [Planctomycetes bacterium]|mgnify:CR=1 FL=1|jgi:hypothetical protein|nr:hypothetical protein [Planctomycetota bacterium]MBT6452794.1 hypothetical protein [Planctomycetota bacterium]MBT6541672.1 hypothetical protein [Planctomycetota bacterium]MBT6785504.1 hypothetical protein [Planctomycetota bacterium]MBT6967591.1 hypothetical protein [Planctomycetota bacterium]